MYCIVNTELYIFPKLRFSISVVKYYTCEPSDNYNRKWYVNNSKLPWKSRVRDMRSVCSSTSLKLSVRQTLEPLCVYTKPNSFLLPFPSYSFSAPGELLPPGLGLPAFPSRCCFPPGLITKRGILRSGLFPYPSNHIEEEPQHCLLKDSG